MTASRDEKGCLLVGIDVGTQGTKGILYQSSTQVILQRESVSYSLAENPSQIEGRAEQDPAIWEHAVETILASIIKNVAAMNENKDNDGEEYFIGGIGVSGQQHGMVPLDASFQPIRNAKLWCDVEAHEESRELSRLAASKMGRTWNVPAGFTAPKVWWMKQNEPENFEKMKYCCLPHDYITFLLCGGRDKNKNATDLTLPVTDAGDASGTGIFDPVTRQYNQELTEIIDEKYFDMLPKVIIEPHAIAGYLSDDWKDRMNIKNKRKICISIGSGDNMCSALGVGCVEPKTAVLSLGTSGTIFGVSSNPISSEQNKVVAPFCDAAGRFLPLICIMSCTGVLENVLSTFKTSAKEGITHDRATMLACDVPKGSHGLLFLPFLNGERTPNWPQSKGALLGITSENMCYIHDIGVLYRAAMEGIAYTLRMGLEEIKNASSISSTNADNETFQILLVVGGGSKNKLWRQIISDVLNVTLKFPVEAESAALGAAFQAGAAFYNVPVDKYVMGQNVKVEDEVVVPSYEDKMDEAYSFGYESFQSWSRKLYD